MAVPRLARPHISSLAITNSVHHESHQTAPQHDGCLGQVRGRAPASAAIRFELVVHVQAPDRWELLVVRRASSSRQYVGEANSGTHTHAECTSEWWKLGRASCPALPAPLCGVRGIDCLPCRALRAFRSRTLPFLSRCSRRELRFALAGSLGCGLRAGTTALRSSRACLAGERACSSRVGVRAFRVGVCGWCVNRELSVTREIWTAGQERRKKERGGETRLLAEQCIIVVITT